MPTVTEKETSKSPTARAKVGASRAAEVRRLDEKLEGAGRCRCGLLLPCAGAHPKVEDYMRTGTSNLGAVVP